MSDEPLPAEAAAQPDPIADLQAWFDRHIPNSRFSRDVPTYNRVFRAVSEIKTALSEFKE